VIGTLLCAGGLALLAVPLRLAGAFGLELLATAFWVWARSAPDAEAQVPRWAWLRHPAAAMWLAAASGAVLEAAPLPGYGVGRLLALTEASAVLWAGLELMAALPLERPYSDRAGPLLTVGPWLPVMLPAAGFLVLWRHADAWVPAGSMRNVVLALLAITYTLAVLRAFGRQRWMATLRWLAVADSALAAMLLARGVVPREVTLVLWAGACGGRAALLAGELRGAAPRRRPSARLLWRLAGWAGSTALAWPLLVNLAFGPGRAPIRAVAVLVALGATVAAWVSVARFVEAPERRTLARRELVVPTNQIIALLTLVTSATGALLAWWSGFQSPWPQPLAGLLPGVVGGGAAWLLTRGEAGWVGGTGQRVGARARGLAHGLAQIVLAIERWLVARFAGLGRALLAPARDIHTGTAQEYLLFLVALGLVGLVLPLLR
jgi:hypothetical protein